MSISTNAELSALITDLANTLAERDNKYCLEHELKTAAKHVPAYIKVVKTHIEQLKKVLALESHNRKTLDNIELSEPVKQLMQIFELIEDDDIVLLEQLAEVAQNWQSMSETKQEASTEVEMSETSN